MCHGDRHTAYKEKRSRVNYVSKNAFWKKKHFIDCLSVTEKINSQKTEKEQPIKYLYLDEKPVSE